jgi:excisionase family DNA binding protein
MDTNTPTLAPDVFEPVVTAFAETLTRHYRERFEQRRPESTTASLQSTSQSPWLGVSEAAKRAGCGIKTIYLEVRRGRLRAARVGGRILRLRAEWVDEWLQGGGNK